MGVVVHSNNIAVTVKAPRVPEGAANGPTDRRHARLFDLHVGWHDFALDP